MKTSGIEISAQEILEKAKGLNPITRRGGKPKLKTAAELRFEAKQKITVKKATGLVPNYCLYTLRHSFATRALLKGVDAITVAEMLGHEDASTLAKVYQHVGKNSNHMLKQLDQIASISMC